MPTVIAAQSDKPIIAGRLLYKTDFAVTDPLFASVGSYYIGDEGTVVAAASEATIRPIDGSLYKQLVITSLFSTVTGTTPSLTGVLQFYDDAEATAPILTGISMNLWGAANVVSTGGSTGGYTITNVGGTTQASASTISYQNIRPVYFKLLLTTSGTFTALGANKRIVIRGLP